MERAHLRAVELRLQLVLQLLPAPETTSFIEISMEAGILLVPAPHTIAESLQRCPRGPAGGGARCAGGFSGVAGGKGDEGLA